MKGTITINLNDNGGEVTFKTDNNFYPIVKYNTEIFECSKVSSKHTIGLVASVISMLADAINKALKEPNLTLIQNDVEDKKPK